MIFDIVIQDHWSLWSFERTASTSQVWVLRAILKVLFDVYSEAGYLESYRKKTGALVILPYLIRPATLISSGPFEPCYPSDGAVNHDTHTLCTSRLLGPSLRPSKLLVLEYLDRGTVPIRREALCNGACSSFVIDPKQHSRHQKIELR